MTFIAGAYSATFNAQAVGILEDGWELEQTVQAEMIRGDNMGDTTQDGVFRGGDCFISGVMREYDAAAFGAIAHYWDSTIGQLGTPDAAGIVDNVGKLLSGLAKQLVLTAATGPNAVPATITADKAILAPGFPIRYILANRPRVIAIRFQLLPYTSGTDVVWWEET